MRKMLSVAAALSLAGGAAFGQASPAPAQPVHKRHHVSTGVEKPVDKGPYTPDANAAYQGGGVILQGAPGAPAPQPQATPPGQTPRGAVPN
jgi:hypothetical protein